MPLAIGPQRRVDGSVDVVGQVGQVVGLEQQVDRMLAFQRLRQAGHPPDQVDARGEHHLGRAQTGRRQQRDRLGEVTAADEHDVATLVRRHAVARAPR